MMVATSPDTSANHDGATPTLPGTYGAAPDGFRLPAGTQVGSVVLQVSDLARSLVFYEQVLGMERVSGDATSAQLSAQDSTRVLVELRERRGAKPAPITGRLGLYHFAILLPDRASLGRFVRHLSEVGARAGSGDHLVSEAYYLNDPDGMAIEVCADRPREMWRRKGRELMMATDPVDVRSVLAAAGDTPWTGMPAGAVVGHVHLHVGDIDLAWAFYGEGMGFDKMVWQYPGALFFGADGYHHHLGTNTWAGSHASAAAEDEARLIEWTVELPSADAIDALTASLVRGGYAAERDAQSVVTRDPWDTQVRARLSDIRAG